MRPYLRFRGVRNGSKTDISAISDVHEWFRFAYAAAMSTKHIRTAADLVRFGAALKVDCCNCGAARTLDGVEVARAAGAGPLKGLARRFRCSRCGMKQARLSVLPPV